MRLARYTRDPMTDVQACVEVGILCVATLQAPKHCLVSERIPRPASRTGEASVGRITEPNRHPCHSGQQQNTLREESRTPLFPPWETVRILKRNTSARLTSTAHQSPSFFGLRLSLRTHFIGPITPLLLVKSATVALFLQYRSQVLALIAVAARYRTSHAHITTNPFSCGLFCGQRHLDGHAHVPFVVLSEDFALLAEGGTRQGQRTIDGTMFLRRDVEFPHALHHDPQIEAFRLAWLLDVGRVNQLSFQRANNERLLECAGGLFTALIVLERPARSTSVKFARTCTNGDTGLFHVHNRLCGNRVQTAEQPRQERQCISLVARREKFQLVRQYSLGCHGLTITKRAEKVKAPPYVKSRSRPSLDRGRSLRLQPSRLPSSNESARCPLTCTFGLRFSLPMLGRAPLGAERPRWKRSNSVIAHAYSE